MKKNRIVVPVGEVWTSPTGKKFRFFRGGDCSTCAFRLRRTAWAGLGTRRAATDCAAFRNAANGVGPELPCSGFARGDGVSGRFVRVESALRRAVKSILRWGVVALVAAFALSIAFAACRRADAAEAFEPRVAESLDDIHRATCRIAALDANGRGAYGSGLAFDYDAAADEYFVLTNYHVVQGVRRVATHWFGDGARRIDADDCPVEATYYDESRPVDAAIVCVARSKFRGYDPPIVPLAPYGTRVEPGTAILSCGCSEGRWAAAWKGGVESYYGETALFYPAPKPGQSGSGVVVRTPVGLRLALLLTLRVGDEKTTPEEKMRGGAYPISTLYDAAANRRPARATDSIPPNSTFAASYSRGDSTPSTPPNAVVCPIDATTVDAPVAPEGTKTAAPTPRGAEVASVANGSNRIGGLLDRNRNGRRSSVGETAPAPSPETESADDGTRRTGPIRGALDRSVENALNKIVEGAKPRIDAKTAELESFVRRKVCETAVAVAFWGAVAAGAFYWAVRGLGTILSGAFASGRRRHGRSGRPEGIGRLADFGGRAPNAIRRRDGVLDGRFGVNFGRRRAGVS